jgi:hypothetical protein
VELKEISLNKSKSTNTYLRRGRSMKWSPILRLVAVSLMTVSLIASTHPVQATVYRDDGSSLLQKLKEKQKEIEKERERQKERSDERDKKPRSTVPEGGGSALLVLAAGVLGGSVLVWRRKRRASVS